MPRRVLESLTGVGEVCAGDVVLRRTHYDLALWVEGQDGRDVQVDGHIDITGMAEALVLAGADQLTLRLQDGRTVRFKLTGTSGGIVGSLDR